MKKSYIIIFAVAVLLIIVAANSVYTVEENEYACIFRFQEIVKTQNAPGLYIKIPFVDKVTVYTKAAMLYDIPPSEVITLDKQNMTVDCYILWKIADPQQFYRSVGTVTEAEVRLDASTYSALKRAMGQLAQADIINLEDGAERNEIYESIAATVNKDAAGYGIQVLDVKIKQFDLPESNLNAVYNRMISERNQMAEKYTADGDYEASIIVNDVDKQVNIIVSNAQAAAAELEAEGEKEYMRLLAEAYNTKDKREFYEFTLALEALESSLTGENKTVILDKDSDLAKILMGAAG